MPSINKPCALSPDFFEQFHDQIMIGWPVSHVVSRHILNFDRSPGFVILKILYISSLYNADRTLIICQFCRIRSKENSSFLWATLHDPLKVNPWGNPVFFIIGLFPPASQHQLGTGQFLSAPWRCGRAWYRNYNDFLCTFKLILTQNNCFVFVQN